MTTKRIRTLWLAYIEPPPNCVRLDVGLWRPVIARVPADVAGDLRDSLVRMGAHAAIVRTEDEARAEVDDLRQRCRCDGGIGRYRCDRCQSEAFVERASQSLTQRTETP